jgi:hypothetical protein
MPSPLHRAPHVSWFRACAARSYGLLRSSFLDYFVLCRANWRARPFLVIWYTHTPGSTIVAPEYASIAVLVLAEASVPRRRIYINSRFSRPCC